MQYHSTLLQNILVSGEMHFSPAARTSSARSNDHVSEIVTFPSHVEHASDVSTWISKGLDTLRCEHRARHLYASPIYIATGIMSYYWARYVWCIHDNPPYHNAQRIVIHNIHSYWGGAHPGGAVIEFILRVRLCRGPASRHEPESHGARGGFRAVIPSNGNIPQYKITHGLATPGCESPSCWVDRFRTLSL